jgi:hypothetical protein
MAAFGGKSGPDMLTSSSQRTLLGQKPTACRKPATGLFTFTRLPSNFFQAIFFQAIFFMIEMTIAEIAARPLLLFGRAAGRSSVPATSSQLPRAGAVKTGRICGHRKAWP